MVSQLHMNSYLQSLLKPAATNHSDMLELFGKWPSETAAQLTEGSSFLCNIREFVLEHTAPHPRRQQYLHTPPLISNNVGGCHENVQSNLIEPKRACMKIDSWLQKA
jgi:hypothetical protein